jgi:hypothetical protein
MDRGRNRGQREFDGQAERPRRPRADRSANYEYDYDEDRGYPPPRRIARRRAYPPDSTAQPRPRPRPRPQPEPRRSRLFSGMLMGCGLSVLLIVIGAAIVVFMAIRASQGGTVGIGPLGGAQKFTKEETTRLALTSLTYIQVCDKIGNITIKVDANATTTIVKTTKIVHKANQGEAEQQFSRITVEVQPPMTRSPACNGSKTPATTGTVTPGSTLTPTPPPTTIEDALIVSVTIPDSEGLLRTTSDSVDVMLTIPQKVLPATVSEMRLDVEAPVGNITVEGLSGNLNINGSTGNIKVTRAVITPDSHIETAQGNVTFNGWLFPPENQSVPSRYLIQSEKGTIDVTLPATTNVTLDANVNVGAIHSEFKIPVNNNGGPVNYHGPLNPDAGPASPTKLILDVSTGDVNIHKAQT